MLETPNILHAIPLETKFVKLSVTTEKKQTPIKSKFCAMLKTLKKEKKKKIINP